MIKFYGVFQLVKVHKEDKTKNGDKTVSFTAASNRGEDKTDFKFFKMFGNNAEYFIRNLQKDNEGKYKSRKMMIEGYVETYTDNQEVVCTANIKKDKIPEQAGFLKADLKIKAKQTIQVQKDIYKVTHFEFVDKKKDQEIEVLINDEMESFDYTDEDEDIEVDNEESVKLTNTIKSTSNSKSSSSRKSSSKNIAKEIDEALVNLQNIDMLPKV